MFRLTSGEVVIVILAAVAAWRARAEHQRARREEARRALARARRLRPQPRLTQAEADAAWDRVADAIRDERAYLPERERIATAADQPVPYLPAEVDDFRKWGAELARYHLEQKQEGGQQ